MDYVPPCLGGEILHSVLVNTLQREPCCLIAANASADGCSNSTHPAVHTSDRQCEGTGGGERALDGEREREREIDGERGAGGGDGERERENKREEEGGGEERRRVGEDGGQETEKEWRT